MFNPNLILATAAARGLAIFPAGAAGAASDGAPAMIVLDELCELPAGMPVTVDGAATATADPRLFPRLAAVIGNAAARS